MVGGWNGLSVEELDRWKRLRAEIHEQVCTQGYDPRRRAFTQYYGSKELDASLLMIPLVGFLPATDERMRGTVQAIEQESSSSPPLIQGARGAKQGIGI